jgi:beta-N-acetylhexosaminidase
MIKQMALFLVTGLFVLGLVSCKPKPQAETCSRIVSESLCEKIGQLLIVGFGGIDQTPEGEVTWRDPNGLRFKVNSRVAHDIKDWHIGGVIYFRGQLRHHNGHIIGDRNVEGSKQLALLSKDLQEYNAKIRQQQHFAAQDLIISIDQEGGLINPLVFVKYLPNFTAQARGELENKNFSDLKNRQAALDFSRNYAQKNGMALNSMGINVDFAPVADVNINPVNPIIGGLSRSFSSNPDIVADQDEQFVQGLASQRVLATLKHFPGNCSRL